MVGFRGVMSPKINVWENSLKQGLKWERKLMEKVADLVISYEIKHFNNDMNKQRQGIDGLISFKDASVEIKTRDFSAFKYKDILLETISIIERNKLGWFYTSKATAVLYVWLNQTKTNFIDGYIIWIQTPKLRKWFELNKHKFSKKIAKTRTEDGNYWHTENRAVPIKSFPKDTIKRFNPQLNIQTDQMDLGTFLRR